MTAAATLQGVKVAILVADLFEQAELAEPRKALEAAGAQTVVVSPKSGEVHGLNHVEPGDTFKVDLSLSDANAADFDALLLPGGVVNADALRTDPKAQEFARQIDRNGKPIAVICHGGWLLVSAGLASGHTLTSWPSLQDDIKNAGGTWVDREVVEDGNWISSRKPDDIPAFNRVLLERLARLH
ncbi:protease PfpI [Silvimonas sp. JCM 19000]